MTTHPTDPPIYPKRYWDASTTFNNWNKLTALDIHESLRTEPGFEGQNVFFHLNHPIRFVRIVGLLVDIELRGRYTILTIDDSSGACIDVKITSRYVAAGDEAEYPSNTTVDNIDVHVQWNLPTLHLDSKPVALGSVLEVKGTISVFRNARQLELKRLFNVPDTNAEAAAWAKTAKWKKDLLSQPWMLTRQERETIDERIRQEEQAERAWAKRKQEWDAKHGIERRRYEEKKEAKRKRADARMNAGALRGSGILRAPWE
ncbi:hypothetical protein B0A55_08701 [Friedmanniomyces simplex]|uniref:CST complex subunit STN1 n=1 Tax=Friedmanniomyces simplex TaxID=329884 RepID=A0A4U0WR24_9PEZI|nr:hypothetical protein B0A55_12251 [Friedmanniomyces simplex]TKA65551.1 hypothetical protein B0A55_08701 [Friedmanniomyces simplex]